LEDERSVYVTQGVPPGVIAIIGEAWPVVNPALPTTFQLPPLNAFTVPFQPLAVASPYATKGVRAAFWAIARELEKAAPGDIVLPTMLQVPPLYFISFAL
jgi:ABC-type Fe3+ transport system permease subunit